MGEEINSQSNGPSLNLPDYPDGWPYALPMFGVVSWEHYTLISYSADL